MLCVTGKNHQVVSYGLEGSQIEGHVYRIFNLFMCPGFSIPSCCICPTTMPGAIPIDFASFKMLL